MSGPQDRELDGQVVDRGGLSREVGREAQQKGALAGHEREAVGAGAIHGVLGQLDRVHVRDGHATPTCTSRKRAGAQPWETRITWPGSPLPQPSSEIGRHSEAEQTASQPRQNSGVMPA